MCWPISPSFIVTAVEKKPLHLFNKCGDASPHRPQNGLAVDFIVSTRGFYLTRQRLRRWLKIGICRFSTVLTIQISGLPSLCPERPALTAGCGSAGNRRGPCCLWREDRGPPSGGGRGGQAAGTRGAPAETSIIGTEGPPALLGKRRRFFVCFFARSAKAGYPF